MFSKSTRQCKSRGMVEWIISDGLTDYDAAVRFMEDRAAAIAEGRAEEAIWLVEHPPLYTAGTSAKIEDLTDPDRFPVYPSKRGGQYTYHGPGQRVAYVMLDVGKRGRDVRRFVKQLEDVEPELEHFSGIVPCGITEHGVTSLVDLGLPVTMADVDAALRFSFETIFRDAPVD